MVKFPLVRVAACSLILAIAACSSPEQKVEKYYASGIEFLEEGDHGRANVQFQNVLKINDQHIPTLIGVATIAEERKDFEAMFGVLQKIVRLDPENTPSLAKLGKLFLLGNDETEALAHAERALAIDPDFIEALTLKAAVQLRLGDKAGAVEIADRVIAVDPANAEASTIVATVRFTDDDLDGALAELDRTLAIDPKRAVLQLLRIRILSQQQRAEDVIAGYESLAQLFPDEPAYLRAYASVLIEQDDLDGALVQLEKVVDIRPNELNAKLDVIRLINSKDGNDAALRRFGELIEEAPEQTDLTFSLAEFHVQRDDIAAARATLEPIVGLGDSAAALRAKNMLAAISLRSGELDNARKLLDEILVTDERNTSALVRRAQLKIQDGDIDDAIADLRTAQNNDPDSYEAMLVMATAFQRQGNNDVARAELAKAFETSQAKSNVANIFARFLIAEGNRERAADILEQSLAANANSVENLRLLAQLRLQNQDWRGAEEIADVLENRSAEDEDAALTIRSVALSGLEEYDQVISLLSEKGTEQPLATSPLATLTSAYISSGRFDEAFDTLNKVIESDGQNYPARLLLAQTHRSAGDNGAFEQALLEAADAAPARPEAYTNLYRYYLQNLERGKAAQIVETGLVNAPDSNALKIYKADVLLTGGDQESALAMYDSMIGELSNNKVVVNNYISLVSELRPDAQNAKAALAYVGAIENEDNAAFKDTIGWAYYRAGDFDKAIEYLAPAAESATQNAEIQYHYGAALFAKGDTETGSAVLEKALSMGGNTFRYESDIRALLARN